MVLKLEKNILKWNKHVSSFFCNKISWVICLHGSSLLSWHPAVSCCLKKGPRPSIRGCECLRLSANSANSATEWCRYACELGRGWFPASLRCWLDPLARGKLHGTAGGEPFLSLEPDPNSVEAQTYVLKWFWLIRGSSQKRTWCHSVRWCYWLLFWGLFYVVLKTKHLNWIQTVFPGFRLFFWHNKNDFGGCVPVPPADGCTYQQDIKASEKNHVSFCFYFFQFRAIIWNLLENFRGLTPEKLCSHPHTKEVVVGFEERRPKALQARSRRLLWFMWLSNLEIFQWTFRTAPFWLAVEQMLHAILLFE